MRTVALGEVASVLMGQAPAGETYNDTGDGLPLIAGAGDFKGDEIAVAKHTSAPTKVCYRGDIVLSIRASIGAKVWSDGTYCLGRGVAAIRPGAAVVPGYLWHWLTRYKNELAAKGRGATFLQVSRADIVEMQMTLPPLDEQRRIAAILDQADALRAARLASLRGLAGLAAATFRGLFGDLDPGPATLGDVADVQGGLQVSAKREALPLTAPYLRVANVHRGRLDLAEVKAIHLTEPELRRTMLRTNDLLFVEGHANPMEVGRVARWDGSVSGCTHQNHLIRGRIDDSRCDSVFAEFWLNSPRGAAHFRRSGNTTSGLNTISASTVRSAPLPSPPLQLQREFASRVAAIDAQRSTAQRSLSALDELFASLQSRAFTGRL